MTFIRKRSGRQETKSFQRLMLVAVLFGSSQAAHAQMSSSASTGDYASDLGYLNGYIVVRGYTRDICVEEFIDMQNTIDVAYNTWREKYKPFLQEIALRWNLLLIQAAKESNSSLVDTIGSASNEFAKLKSATKNMYSKDGLEEFRNICEQYPIALLSEKGNIEKRYPEHVQTIRKVKIQ